MAFTTLAKVKSALRISSGVTSSDDFLNDLIESAGAMLLGDIGGGLTSATTATYVDTFDVTRSGYGGLRLSRWPVLAVTEIRTGTSMGAAGSVLPSTEYSYLPVGIVRLQGDVQERLTGRMAWWPIGAQNVRATYSAGFVPGSQDYVALAFAELQTVVSWYNTVPSEGRESEKIGSYAYKRRTDAAGVGAYPAAAARVVGRYRSVFAHDPVVP